MKRELNYNSFLKLNVRPYQNKWLALVDGKVVSSRNTFKEVFEEAKKQFPKKRPLIVKIPSKKVMIL